MAFYSSDPTATISVDTNASDTVDATSSILEVNDCTDALELQDITDSLHTPLEANNSVTDFDLVEEEHRELNEHKSYNSVSDDPADWVINDFTIEYLLRNGTKQNQDSDFSKSSRQYSGRTRIFTESVFTRRLINGKIRPRSYLVYSISQGTIFCTPCRLFGGTSTMARQGFSDWKKWYVSFKLS